jgi:prepilin signal peptidase PulO-like enzyme (type II secretory pathway)
MIFYVTLLSFLFIFGIIIGSFLNVLILRHGTGWGISGRSKCLVCNTTLTAVDLVPILSYLILRTRCRHCRTPISPQYPFIELLTGILFTLAGLSIYLTTQDLLIDPYYVITKLILLLAIITSLVFLLAYDMRQMILPDKAVFMFIFLAILFRLILHPEYATMLDMAYGALATTLPLFLIYLVTRGMALGFGDVKLSIGIGILLGPLLGITAIWYSFVIGAFLGIILILTRNAKRTTMIPFAPFLITGLFITLFTQYNIYDLLYGVII